MVNIEEFRKAQRAEGPAMIMAIGTATPPNCVLQSTYPDYYFRVTKCEHKKELKEKFRRMCDKSMIKTRYMYLTEGILKENPNMCAHMAPSIEERQEITVVEVPKLGAEAATRAIREWGQPKSMITHVVFSSLTGIDMPGADYQLIKLLGLPPSVKRVMLYQQGCFVGAAVLRVAKDMAENNKGARVLVVCSELVAGTFRGPSETHFDALVEQSLFGEGASAIIVGCDPLLGVEKPFFQIISACQTIVPESDGAIKGHLGEAGLVVRLKKDVPRLVGKHIEKSLVEAFQPLGMVDWNSLFWIVHPGGPAILNQLEENLRLNPEKLRASRKVLSEYGNLASACVYFILNEMRHSSAMDGSTTTGEGLEWGVLLGFGPGVTVDTVVLHSVSI